MNNDQIVQNAADNIAVKALGLPKGSQPIGPFVEILVATLLPMLLNCFGGLGVGAATERVKRLGLFQRAQVRRKLWEAYGTHKQGNAAADSLFEYLHDNSDEHINEVVAAAFNTTQGDDTGLF